MILPRSRILVIIVIAQFACVSLWFAGNGFISDLSLTFNLDKSAIGHLTSAVQFGFISGTLIYAIYSIADRFSPSLVFLVSAIAASLCNLIILVSEGLMPLLYGSRFLTGFFLAGIYPVGMKIAADYYDKDLGKALGYLLGALVLGTAFPHLLKSVTEGIPGNYAILFISLLALLGGTLVYFLIPDGPFRKRSTAFNKAAFFHVFGSRQFRSAAFGYFGHMWELYAFWTFIPVVLTSILSSSFHEQWNISQRTFFIIGIGSIACVIGGYFAQRIGSYKVAVIALTLSGLCCLLSPLIFSASPVFIFLFLLCWGMFVIMDSPQFSTLIAQSAPAENKGTALTIVNCIGFSITIISIQLLNLLSAYISMEWIFVFLLPGPVLGLISLVRIR